MSRPAQLPLLIALLIAGVAARAAPVSDAAFGEGPLLPEVEAYVQARIEEFDSIPADRKQLLEELAAYVSAHRSAGKTARLTFICTHNSRRSHLSQVWAAVAAARYGVERVDTFSGGTEATAFNPRAVAALKRAGLRIEATSEGLNPKYSVATAEGAARSICFSKVYNQAPNPKEDFCAVMTCTQADEACPTVAGASLRLAIAYEDPKASDGTPEESATYDERCAQIAREMLYALSRVH